MVNSRYPSAQAWERGAETVFESPGNAIWLAMTRRSLVDKDRGFSAQKAATNSHKEGAEAAFKGTDSCRPHVGREIS